MVKSSRLYLGFQIDWAAKIRESWDFTEEGAHVRLEAFLQDGEAACKRFEWVKKFSLKSCPLCHRCVQIRQRVGQSGRTKHQLLVPLPSFRTAQPTLAFVGCKGGSLQTPQVPTQASVEGLGLLAAQPVS